MKNPGLYATVRYSARPLDRRPSADLSGQRHWDHEWPSGHIHGRQHLLHLAGAALEEPEQALQVDHRADPMVLQSHLYLPNVTRSPQPMSHQVGNLTLDRCPFAVRFLKLGRGLLGARRLEQPFVIVTGDCPAGGLALDAAREQRTRFTDRPREMEARHRPALRVIGARHGRGRLAGGTRHTWDVQIQAEGRLGHGRIAGFRQGETSSVPRASHPAGLSAVP